MMNLVYPVMAAALALAVFAGGDLPETTATPASAENAVTRSDAEIRYELIVYGTKSGCSVIAGAPVSEAKRKLALGDACLDIAPDLSGASYWIERSGGVIAFAGDDGGVLAKFAVADGAAFETFEPGKPMMALIAAN